MDPLLHTEKEIRSTSAHFSEQSENEVLGAVKSSRKGLTQEEAERRLNMYGENTMQRKKAFCAFEAASFTGQRPYCFGLTDVKCCAVYHRVYC